MNNKLLGGNAKWLAYRADKNEAPKEIKSAWAEPVLANDKLTPDEGGLSMFRKSFKLNGKAAGVINATSLGVFEIYCNGLRVGRTENGETVYDEMKPGWVEYHKRVLYDTYDLTPCLKDGENTILAVVAKGWWAGRISFGTYGETEPEFAAQLEISDKDGKKIIVTDESWLATRAGKIRASDIWDGERYDNNEASYGDISNCKDTYCWIAPTIKEHNIEITKYLGTTVKIREHLTQIPHKTTVYNGTEDNGTQFGKIRIVKEYDGFEPFTLKYGETVIFDLSQNMVGEPYFKIKCAKDTEVLVKVCEMCNDTGDAARGNDGPQGSMYTTNYRSAVAKAWYKANGDKSGEEYMPKFTFFGFRYIGITASADVEILDIKGKVLGNDNREVGKMTTSDENVNKLLSNIIWGQRGNFLSVPTDCPQRDERLGWSGDTQIFSNTAMYNADMRGFFEKWMQDARDSQSEQGVYPDVIPRIRVVGEGGAAWSDVGIIVPYNYYVMYGCKELIEKQYPSMERYMDFLAATELEGPHPTYGDWLSYEPTDSRLIAVAYYAYDASMMAELSRALGKPDREKHYLEVFDNVSRHFREKYCNADGTIKAEHASQTTYLLALHYKLLPENQIKSAVAALKKKIIDNGYKLSCGFVGVGILCKTLAEYGENNLAYSLLLQREDPSWLYSVDQGATTIWERWNSYTLARGFGDAGMNSFNHYSYGSVQEWMYRYVCGINTDFENPGFSHITLTPCPDTRCADEIPSGQKRITHAYAQYESVSGMIESGWSLESGFVYEVKVPTTATLYLPVIGNATVFYVNGIEHKISDTDRTPDGLLKLDLASGEYLFKM